MIRVASYCRVSTDKEDQANSFETQVRYFKEYIQHRPEWVLAGIYADEGITGTSTKKRTQFNRMMNDAYERKFDILITKEVSRFSRNILDAIAYTRELKTLGVYVIFMNDGFSTADPDAELRLSIMGAIAQEESRKTSTRVTWGQTRQMEKGVVFGRSLLGYDVKGGRMTVNPEGAELVCLIFHKYAVEKMGTTSLCRWLEEHGYKTSSGNPHWSNSHLVKILKNEKYVGDLVQKKTYTPDYLSHEKKTNPGEKIVIPNHHEPIVDRELWELAQKELSKNSRKRTAAGVQSKKHLFSGLIRCGECGKCFVSHSKRGADGSIYRRWVCSGRDCHVGRILRDDDALNMVKTALAALDLDVEGVIDQVVKVAALAVKSEENSTLDSTQRLQRELERYTKKKAIALERYLDGTLSQEEMELMRHWYDQETKKLRQRIDSVEKRQATQLDTQQLPITMDCRLRTLLCGEDISQLLHRTVLESIHVYKDRHLELRFCGLKQVFRFE